MIGEWVVQNVGATLSIAGVLATGASWILVHWIGDRFEPKKPTLTEEQKRLLIEEKARAVLSTEQIGLFADATVQKAYQSAKFFENVEGVAIASKAIQKLIDERCQHANLSHESAIRIIISDATKAVGDQLQKSLTDSQAMFMSELRGMRSDMAENMKAISEHVGELDTALQVHKAHDDAKRA